MRSVLCFGDSNTWGAATAPRPGDRYPWPERWPGVLSASLGGDWQVIEEGLSGRTTVHRDPVEGEWLCGADYLLQCLRSHQPLDAVVVMLGTNDLKARFAVGPYEIAAGVGRLLSIVATAGVGPDGGRPKVLVVCPPPILPKAPGFPDWYEIFSGGADKSQGLAKRYAEVATEFGAAFLDAGGIIRSSTFDGIHLDASEHGTLGAGVAAAIHQLV